MVLGKPGSGKSTFLRHLAVACCKAEFQADHIPILIELRDIKDISRFDLLNKIHKEFGLANQAQTEEILNQGKVLILLDGLDEVPGQSRRDVQDHIYEFSKQYYKNRFILTCRTQTTEYTLPTFEYVEVAEFKPGQVEIFAQNWFTALAETPEQGAELTVKFLEKLRLPENKPTAELAVTPILLSLTCWVFNDLKDLPTKRSNLYEQGINLLLEKWDEKRGVRREVGSEVYRKLSVVGKKKLLSYVAARKFEQEQYVLFEQSEIQEYIAEYLGISTEDSEALLDAVEAQHGLLIERALRFWSFSHLTFQEYFAAKWFCDRADWQGLAAHVGKKRWREVFLLVIGMAKSTDQANELLVLMKKNNASITSDTELKAFLTWVQNQSASLQGSFMPALRRISYLLLSDAFVLNFIFVDALNGECSLNGDSKNTLKNAIGDFIQLETNFTYILTSAHSSRMINESFSLTIELSFLLIFNLDLKLEEILEHLHLLKKSSDYNKEIYERCVSEAKLWSEKLRAIMFDYRNTAYQWKFSQQQKEVFKQYYDTNLFLIECLNMACTGRNEVSEKIKETLFLPIPEIENSQQHMQVVDVADE
jgi:hypothetical protein